MTIDTQKLREAAQAVIDDFGDAWYDAGDWKIMGDDRPPVVDEQFIEVATPTAVVGLIDALDSQTAEIARLKAAQAWQPIETAPKDGRTLLLGYYNSHGNWRTMRGQWMSETYIAEHWEDPGDEQPGWFETSVEADDMPNCWRIEPTHWMPLPAAPDALSGESHD